MIKKIKKFFSRLRRRKNKVFIAMWMNKKYLPLSTAIKEALKRAGYEGYRIDDISHNKQITEEIFCRIKKSPFIVADFTHDDKEGPRGSVFYEAGYARGAGIEVVHTCKNNILKKQQLSFDTSQFTHITWKDRKEKAMKEFVSELTKHIVQSMGRKTPLSPQKQKKEIKKEEDSFVEDKNSGKTFLVSKDSKGRTIAERVFFDEES